jgi:uncharacterized protein YodC (DUF2158 family)
MAAKFKPGDVVKLKSGGPNMTVHNYIALGAGTASQTVRCKWFAGAKSETGDFHEAALLPAEDEKPKK